MRNKRTPRRGPGTPWGEKEEKRNAPSPQEGDAFARSKRGGQVGAVPGTGKKGGGTEWGVRQGDVGLFVCEREALARRSGVEDHQVPDASAGNGVPMTISGR